MKKSLVLLSIIIFLISVFFLVGCNYDKKQIDNLNEKQEVLDTENVDESSDESSDEITEDEAMQLVDEKSMVSEGIQVGALETSGEYESDGSSTLPLGTYITVSETDTENYWYVNKNSGEVYYQFDSEGNIKKLDQENYENKITQIYEDEDSEEVEKSLEDDGLIKPGVNIKNYNRINNNTTFAEVQYLFGVGEFKKETMGSVEYVWQGDTGGEVTIAFNKHDKKVFYKRKLCLID